MCCVWLGAVGAVVLVSVGSGSGSISWKKEVWNLGSVFRSGSDGVGVGALGGGGGEGGEGRE